MTPTSIKLLVLLAKGNHKLITAFKSYTSNNEDIFEQKSLIFSILSNNLVYKWDNEYLEKLHLLYKRDIISFTTDMKIDEFFWLRENIDAVAYLIDKQFGKLKKLSFENLYHSNIYYKNVFRSEKMQRYLQ